MLPIDRLADMTDVEEAEFWKEFEAEIAEDDDTAARETLAAGLLIYTQERDTPPDHVIRTWPDGRRELLLVAEDGTKTIINAAA